MHQHVMAGVLRGFFRQGKVGSVGQQYYVVSKASNAHQRDEMHIGPP